MRSQSLRLSAGFAALLAASVGLDRGEVESILASDAYTRDVRADEEDAHQLGIHGVPHFMFGPRHTVSGAQPTAALLDALTIRRRKGRLDGQVVAICGDLMTMPGLPRQPAAELMSVDSNGNIHGLS